MDKRNEAKLSMFRAVSLHCSSNQSIVNSNLAFKAAVANYDAKINALLSTESSAQKKTKGITLDKGTARKILNQSAYDNAAQIFAYASKNNNETLKQSVNFPISDLQKLKDELIVTVCNNIKKAMSDNLAALADYGFNAASITAFQTDIDNYAGTSPKPRNATAQKSTDVKKVAVTIKDITKILKEEMDKLVVSLRKANPDFVTKYFEVRKIIDVPSRKKTEIVVTPPTV